MSSQQPLGQRHYLLAQQDANQADQRDHWWRRRAHAYATVEDADHYAGGQSDHVHTHRRSSRDAGFAGMNAVIALGIEEKGAEDMAYVPWRFSSGRCVATLA
jgi:hypothetical protein